MSTEKIKKPIWLRLYGYIFILWWRVKARIWLWRWNRWIKRLRRLEPSVALLEIANLKRHVIEAGFTPDWETAFIDGLTILEDATRSRRAAN